MRKNFLLKNLCWLLLLFGCVLSAGQLQAQTTVTLGGQANAATAPTFPIYRSSAASSYNYSRGWMVIPASVLTAAGITNGNSISQIAWEKSSAFTLSAGFTANMSILMKNSTATSANITSSWATITSGMTTVYTNSSVSPPASAGYWTITLTTPIVYTGGALEIAVDWAISSGSGNPSTGSIYWNYSDNTGTNLSSLSNSNIYCVVSGNSTAFASTDIIGSAGIGYSTAGRFTNTKLTQGLLAACSGTPVAGTISGPGSVCSGVSFALSNTGATVTGTGLSYAWQSSANGTTGWTNISGQTAPTTASVSQSAVTYYRFVDTCTASGLSAVSNVIQVNMNAASSCYCTPQTNCTLADRIDSVGFVTIANASSCSTNGYGDFTTQTANIVAGSTYPIAVKVGDGGTEYAGVWIDYDNSGTFDASEFTAIGSGNGVVLSGSMIIPSTAPAGAHRMRVRVRYGTALTGTDGCTVYTYGETEDYTVNVTVPSCLAPAGLNFTSVTGTSATIGWNRVTGSTSYEYAITTSSTPPASGTTTTSNSATVNSIAANAILFAYVRTNCGAGGFSTWTSKAFVPCVTNIAPANAATGVSIPTTFNWTPIASATSYQILVSSDNGVTYPLSAVVAAPPITLGGLSFSTNYKFYVRAVLGADSSATSCAATNATSFTTQAAPPPPANDNCSGAIALTPGATVNGTSVSATQSLAPSTCTGFASSTALDVWYRATALSNGTFTVSVSSTSGFDAVLGIYHGSCGALVFDTCRDNTATNGTEAITFTSAVAGTNYYIRVYRYNNGVDSSGTFTIIATGPALPVTGIVLSGVRNGSKAQLSWQTLTETNNAGFELQRSADGRNFTGIAQIASKASGGNSTAAITYNAEDVKPFSGANYYRLKQTDKDGKTSYSNTVYLKGAAVSTLTLSAVYPNPTRDVLKAAVQAPAAQNIEFVITDMMGKTISRQAATVVSGDNTISINVAALPAGSYLLKVICRNGCETTYQKFTRQ